MKSLLYTPNQFIQISHDLPHFNCRKELGYHFEFILTRFIRSSSSASPLLQMKLFSRLQNSLSGLRAHVHAVPITAYFSYDSYIADRIYTHIYFIHICILNEFTCYPSRQTFRSSFVLVLFFCSIREVHEFSHEIIDF